MLTRAFYRRIRLARSSSSRVKSNFYSRLSFPPLAYRVIFRISSSLLFSFLYTLHTDLILDWLVRSSLPVYVRWVRYLSWLLHSTEALTIIQWRGVHNICECYRVRHRFARVINANLSLAGEASVKKKENKKKKLERTFSFPPTACETSEPELPCLTEGAQVLDRYDFDESNLWTDVLLMAVIYAVFHLSAYVCLRRRCKSKWNERAPNSRANLSRIK